MEEQILAGTAIPGETQTSLAPTQVEDNQPPESTIEDRARTQGWRPKDEYDGPSDKWVSAETFVAKGELIDKIEALGRELKEQRRANHMLLEHHNKVKISEFNRALEFLKVQKKEALESGDADRVVELDEQLATVRDTQRMQAAQEQANANRQQPLHPEFVSWAKQNDWYSSDKDLRETADALGLKHAQNNPGLTPTDVLEHVSKQIKKIYPEKFTNPNRNKPSAVEGNAPAATRKSDSFELSDEERQVMNTFVRSGVMSKEDYIKELKSMKGIK